MMDNEAQIICAVIYCRWQWLGDVTAGRADVGDVSILSKHIFSCVCKTKKIKNTVLALKTSSQCLTEERLQRLFRANTHVAGL